MSGIGAARTAKNNYLIGLISFSHGYSHFVMLALQPMFLLMQPELGVSYAALGAIVSAMAVTTGLGQIPMGFLVARFGGRSVLLAGLALMSVSLAGVGFTDGYWPLVALFALAGIGNSVFHPADYAIMIARLDDSIFGRAVSIHAFAGYMGWAVAAAVMLPLGVLVGWREAISVVGVAGLVCVAVLLWKSDLIDDHGGETVTRKSGGGGIAQGFALMRSMPMVMMFLFFALTAMATSGIMGFSVVANVSLHGVTEIMATGILTSHLVASAVGVLIGGWLADRTDRHNFVTSVAIIAMSGFVALLAFGGIGTLVMMAAMVLSGLLYGISTPSRDVMVKQGTPPGAAGVTFGFTSAGLSVGNLIGPVLFGWILDLGKPSLFYGLLSAIIVLSVSAVLLSRSAGRDV
jgi:predicted MFS family arabinose efflux permease